MVRVDAQAKDPRRIRSALLVLPVVGAPTAHVGALPVTKELRRRGFEGKLGERAELGKVAGIAAERVVAYGVGTDLDEREAVRRLAGTAVLEAKRLGIPDAVVALPTGSDGEPAGRAAAEGVLLANYRFTAYSGERAREEERRRLRQVTLAARGLDVRVVKLGIRRGTQEAEAARFARDLVNTPAVHLTPRALAAKARELAKRSRSITAKVFGPSEVEALGMGAYAAVARGSDEPLQFIHLAYRPEMRDEGREKSVPRVVLVGKGVTFDAGGYSLKTAEGMETMKMDMAGAAAVLGVFSALATWQPDLEVHGIIAACENLISGRAMKPGDIVRAKSGKTIEVVNTDAEGRLTLADALSYAVELKPDAIIDLATLTGSCVVALGEEIAGLFSNSEALAATVQAAAEESGEHVWRMPLHADYREFLKSEIADLQNIRRQGSGAGATTAALFLKEFVGDTPWVHLDIAGPAFAEKQALPYVPVGGTGFGVRLVLHYLERLRNSTGVFRRGS